MKAEKSLIQLKIEADLTAGAIRSDVDARRLRILAAAVQECSEVGFQNASIASVARRAGVSTATIYREHKDKVELIAKCVAYVVPILAQAVTSPEDAENPFINIRNMLISHGKAMGDPFMTWLYRLYVGADGLEQYESFVDIARAGRAFTQAHWATKLETLERQGYLVPSVHVETTNLLLGQIERRTILAQLLYGPTDSAKPSLEAVARFAATSLFASLGTDAFHRTHAMG